MVAWIVALMLAVAPPRNGPARVPYPDLAHAVADAVAAEPPLFAGPHGRERGAAVLLALAWKESAWALDVAEGRRRGKAGECGMWQVMTPPVPCDRFVSNHAAEARHVLGLIRRSRGACRANPPELALAVYASGRCDSGHDESRARIRLAKDWFRRYPPG